MKVGYIGNLFLTHENKRFENMVYFLSEEAKVRELTFLIVTGGISYNYEMTLSFVEKLGRLLKENDIQLRFIAGNTDFYYTPYASVIDKETKFREILRLYSNSEYYLPTHPIITKSIRITGAETWYDYTLYRGKPRDLKDITRKSFLFVKSRDNEFITSRDDYTLGINDTFDKRYTQETLRSLKARLDSNEQKYATVSYNIVVQYFSPTKSILKSGLFQDYFGAFSGSMKYMDILKLYRVNYCIVGVPCKCRSINLNRMMILNPDSKKIMEVMYD